MANDTIPQVSKAAKPFMGTREEAKLARAIRYIDGKPCNRGHNPTIRLTSNTQCVACRDLKQVEIKKILREAPGFIDGMILRGKAVYRGTPIQAEAAGALYYVNYRRPCNKGHDPAIRLTSTQACVLCANKYHDDHKDHINAEKRQKRANNPELFSKTGKARYARNPSYFKESSKKWTIRNPDRRRENETRRRGERFDELAIYYRNWRKANPEKIAAKVHKRRANKLGSTEHFIADDIIRISEAQGHACAYCWRPFTKGTRAADHYIPLANRGSNGPDNIVMACRSPCNVQKSARSAEVFIKAQRKRLLASRALHDEPMRTYPLLPILAIIDNLLNPEGSDT